MFNSLNCFGNQQSNTYETVHVQLNWTTHSISTYQCADEERDWMIRATDHRSYILHVFQPDEFLLMSAMGTQHAAHRESPLCWPRLLSAGLSTAYRRSSLEKHWALSAACLSLIHVTREAFDKRCRQSTTWCVIFYCQQRPKWETGMRSNAAECCFERV